MKIVYSSDDEHEEVDEDEQMLADLFEEAVAAQAEAQVASPGSATSSSATEEESQVDEDGDGDDGGDDGDGDGEEEDDAIVRRFIPIPMEDVDVEREQRNDGPENNGNNNSNRLSEGEGGATANEDDFDTAFLACESDGVSPMGSPVEQKLLNDPLVGGYGGMTMSQTGGSLILQCVVCEVPADFLCSRCWKSSYCSELHQLEHFESHKVDCEHNMLLRKSESVLNVGPINLTKLLPVLEPEEEGEKDVFPVYVLTSSADTAEGEILLEEKPFLISPWCRTQLRKAEVEGTRHLFMRNMTCFGCCKYLGFSYTTCQNCSLPLCSQGCREKGNHEKNECTFVKSLLLQHSPMETNRNRNKLGDRFNLQNFRTPDGDEKLRMLYMDVMILRLMLKLSEVQLRVGPEEYEVLWSKLCATWKSNLEQRLAFSSTAQKINMDVEEALPISCLAAKGRTDVVLHYYSIVEGNSFRFDLPFRRFNALCTTLNHTGHNCKPNSIAVVEENLEANDSSEPALGNLTIKLRAGKQLTGGEFVTISYVPVFLGTVERTKLLQDWYAVGCSCKRCVDPYEDGAYSSSPICPSCHVGRLIPPCPATIAIQGAAQANNKKDSGSSSGVNLAKVIWNCINNRTKKCDTYNGSLVSNKTILDALEEMEEQCCMRFGNLRDIGDVLHHIGGQGSSRYGSVNRRHTLTVPKTHSVVMKILDDILRGALFPLPDFTVESLLEFDSKSLSVINEAYNLYASAMKGLQPGFNFEGFPKLILEMAINEHELRKISPTDALAAAGGGASRTASLALAAARGLQRSRTVRINANGDIVWAGGRIRGGLHGSSEASASQRLDAIHAALTARVGTGVGSQPQLEHVAREIAGLRGSAGSNITQGPGRGRGPGPGGPRGGPV